MFEESNNKIDITILVTSYSERDITIETVNYYSEICKEVILIDEEEPYLSSADINNLKYKGTKYIPFADGFDKSSLSKIHKKRLIGARNATNKFLVHSNHDERYTYSGLLACLTELKNNNQLSFCAGQAVAVRKDKATIHFTRAYKKLCGYQNINKVDNRLYYHAENYCPIAHFSVWKKELYIDALEKTIKIHDLIPTTTMMEEVIFELAADLTGNSKAIPELYWVRNRINRPLGNANKKGKDVFKIIKNKLNILFDGDESIQVDTIIKSFWKNFPFVRPTLLSKIIIIVKRSVRIFIKKKKITDIDTLLNNSKVICNKNDFATVLRSMTF